MEDEPMFEILERPELVARMRETVDSVASQLSIIINNQLSRVITNQYLFFYLFQMFLQEMLCWCCNISSKWDFYILFSNCFHVC